MASYQERNGKYLLKVYIGTDSNGKKRFKSKTYEPKETATKKIKKEVEAAAAAFEEQVKSGRYLDGETVKFKEVLDLWLRDYGRPNLDSFTLETYLRTLEQYALPVFGSMPIGRIRAAHVQGIVTEMRNGGLSTVTIKRKLCGIRSVFKYAYMSELIESDPCGRVQLPKNKTEAKLKIFTQAEAERFLNYLENYPIHAFKDKEAVKSEERTRCMWLAYFRLALASGMRRGEETALRWSDIDFNEHTVSINKAFAHSSAKGQYQKDPKTATSVRTIPITGKTIAVLENWRREQRELSKELGSLWTGAHVNTLGERYDTNYVFCDQKTGGPMYVDTPSQKFRKVIERYNASCKKGEELPYIGLHGLRHTCATLLIAAGTDIETVSYRLGHSDAAVTWRVYTHYLPIRGREAAETMERLLS